MNDYSKDKELLLSCLGHLQDGLHLPYPDEDRLNVYKQEMQDADYEEFIKRVKHLLREYPMGDKVAQLFDNHDLLPYGVQQILRFLPESLFRAYEAEITPISHLTKFDLTGDENVWPNRFEYHPALYLASEKNMLSLLKGLADLLPFNVEICHVRAPELGADSILEKVPTVTTFCRTTYLGNCQANIDMKSKSEEETALDDSYDCGILYVSDVDMMHSKVDCCEAIMTLLCRNYVIKNRILPTKWLVILSSNALKEGRMKELKRVIYHAVGECVLYTERLEM